MKKWGRRNLLQISSPGQKRWATKESFVSQLSGAKDVFLSPTQGQESQSFFSTVSRYVAPGENRGSALASFRLRYACKGFRADQSRVLEELEVAANKYIAEYPQLGAPPPLHPSSPMVENKELLIKRHFVGNFI
jgi:hypothetical protein